MGPGFKAKIEVLVSFTMKSTHCHLGTWMSMFPNHFYPFVQEVTLSVLVSFFSNFESQTFSTIQNDMSR